MNERRTRKIGPKESWSNVIEGKITEAALNLDISKAELSKQLGYGPQFLQKKANEKGLGQLDIMTVALIAEAAGYDIVFWRKQGA